MVLYSENVQHQGAQHVHFRRCGTEIVSAVIRQRMFALYLMVNFPYEFVIVVKWPPGVYVRGSKISTHRINVMQTFNHVSGKNSATRKLLR